MRRLNVRNNCYLLMLKVKNLSVKSKQESKKHLLDNVSLEVGKDEIHCVLGKNGSGKTTLAYVLMGLERYNTEKGKVIFNGQDITKKKTYERARLGLSIAFQEPARFEGLTVRDFLLAGKKKTSKENELKKVLKLVDLDKIFLERKLDEKLSGGERKRIELASVIIMRPKLMILDEPDASLDILVYNELYDLLLKIKKELKCSILLITHREEAGLIADKATLIDGGKIIKSGKFREVMRTYCEREGKKKRCVAFRLGKQLE